MVGNSSELILNSDGSVYHLALKPGDVADTIITVGDPERVSKVSSFFDSIKLRISKREFVTHTGSISDKEVTVISTGIGTDNVDIVLNELHALKKMTKGAGSSYKFIRLGTSGAVREDVPMESILISEAAIGLDNLMHFYEWSDDIEAVDKLIQQDEKWKALPRPYAAYADKDLFSNYRSMCDVSGVTITAPGFYAPQGRSVNLSTKVPDFIDLLSRSSLDSKSITNMEMETSGIYGLSAALGHQAVSISAILANRYTGEFSKNSEKVVDTMIKKAMEVITA